MGHRVVEPAQLLGGIVELAGALFNAGFQFFVQLAQRQFVADAFGHIARQPDDLVEWGLWERLEGIAGRQRFDGGHAGFEPAGPALGVGQFRFQGLHLP
ncbi:hypothetical protein Y695_03078 [Hydrogenophaga sp. T4]|nr:hypothetical protein Y695_03078 [Hydrogenophaga sp. T4]